MHGKSSDWSRNPLLWERYLFDMRSNHSAIKHNLCATKRKGGKSESRSFMSKQKQLQCKGEVKAECRKSVQTAVRLSARRGVSDRSELERNIRTKHSSNILHKSLIDVCECSYIMLWIKISCQYLLLFMFPLEFPWCFPVSICTTCVCVLVSAVFHYQSPQGRKPLLVSAVDTAVFFLGRKNNKLIRGCTSCLLRFNCIRVWVPTESRWSEAETHAA